MDFQEQCFDISVLNNKCLKIFMYIVLILTAILITYISFASGKFDFEMFIIQSISMYSILIICFKISYKTIKVGENQFIYKGFLCQTCVEYSKINKVQLLEESYKHKKTFTLYVEGEKDCYITFVELYKMNEIEELLKRIAKSNITLINHINTVIKELKTKKSN